MIPESYLVLNYFHVQILLISLLFCSRAHKRNYFVFRCLFGGALYVAIPFWLPGGYFNSYLRIGSWFTLGFFCMLLLVFLLIWFCFALSPRETLFYVCTAHSIQHMIHCLTEALRLGFSISDVAAQWLQVVLMAVLSVGCYLLLSPQLKGNEKIELNNLALLAFAIFSIGLIYGLSLWTTSVEEITVGYYLMDTFCCVLLLIILFDMFEFRKMKKQNLIMLHLLEQERRQNELSKQSIELINRKCHDLKHQISRLRRMEDADEKEESLRNLEQAVLIYDHFAKTGNDSLDLLLAEKGLLCEQKGIKLRYMLGGGNLDFLSTEDLYSLFGNALDNAIESAEQIAEPQKRLITLNAAVRAGFFVIHIENTCFTRVDFVDGLPVTSKPDKDYHGYGMRSMRYITEKYGGTMSTGYEEGQFSVNFLFPMS